MEFLTLRTNSSCKCFYPAFLDMWRLGEAVYIEHKPQVPGIWVLAAEEPSVIISRRPCALLKYVRHPGPIAANPDKCVGCKSCMKIGCPAISISEGKAVIDNTLCTGCGVCGQLCKFDALSGKKEA